MAATTERASISPGSLPVSEDVGEYLAALRRRRIPMVVVAIVIAGTFAAIAKLLPPVYRSSATILIEQQEIPADLVRSTVTGYADERIQQIAQRVMTTSNLLELVDKYDLYPEKRGEVPAELLVGEIRDVVSVEMVSADVIDPRSGRPTKATIAFRIAFEDESPARAQRVVNELTSLYLNENLKTRRQLAASATGFLDDEIVRLESEVSELEQRLAEFKEGNVDSMPELNSLNLQLLDRTERELIAVEAKLRTEERNQVLLAAQLAQLSPTLEPRRPVPPRIIEDSTGRQQLVDPYDQLKALETRYATLTGVYSESHPDVRRAERELAALRAQLADPGGSEQEALLTQLETARADLAVARERYSASHPDVRRLERAEQALAGRLASAEAAPRRAVDEPAVNPAFVQITGRLEGTGVEIENLRKQRDELRLRRGGLEERLRGTPEVERQYRLLARDYENAKAKYLEIKSKQMEARLAETLEAGQKAERFELIEPALLPEAPVRPNRRAIAMLGIVLAFAGGIGTGAVLEGLDRSVRGARAVARLVGEAPLGVIPSIETPGERRVSSLRRVLALLMAVGFVAAALAAVHLLVMRLDLAWFALMERIAP